MDASKGGFNAYDTWRNDIGDYVSPSTRAVTPGSLIKNGTGTLELAGNNSWSGATVVNEGALVFTGQSNLPGAFTNNAVVSLTSPDAPRPGRMLTVGSYNGGAGSQLIIAAQLGGDASPADKLQVTGGTTGATEVLLVTAGGTGAETSDGIKIIEVGGASNGNFDLAGGDYVTKNGQHAIIAGIYGYSLQQNGLANPADGDWYLRSQVQPGIPVYEAYGQALLSLNSSQTLQQRVGNRYWNDAAAAEANGAQPAAGTAKTQSSLIWGNIQGLHGEFEPEISTSSADFSISTFMIEAGVDGQFHESDEGRLIGGVTVHYGNSSTDIISDAGDGAIKTDGYGIGATLTWYGNNGFYVDGEARATWYDSSLNSSLIGELNDSNGGFGYTLSGETGWRIPLDNNWSLTPQAELTWSSVDFDSFAGPHGAGVSLDHADSLLGRLGLSIETERSWRAADGTLSRGHFYGIANLYNEFRDGSQVDVSDVSFDSRNDRLWGGVGVGGSYNWDDDRYSVYGEGAVNTSLADFGDSYTVKGSVGFRMQW
jgi:outer membrane autotransporter protein